MAADPPLTSLNTVIEDSITCTSSIGGVHKEERKKDLILISHILML